MAKTINSICFTTLLLVVLIISAEIPKSEAWCDKYLGEATVPYPCKDRYCEAKCAEDYKESCRGDCEEDHDDGVHLTNDNDDYEEHCYCYGRH